MLATGSYGWLQCYIWKTDGNHAYATRKRESINLKRDSLVFTKLRDEEELSRNWETLEQQENFSREHKRQVTRKQYEKDWMCSMAYSDNNESRKPIKADSSPLETRCAPDRLCSLVGNLMRTDKKKQ
ncbi:hypothetical protein CUMW_282380 [Citrus unshiu]|uniref:Uncharacterized protein n=1 Tax=Citrus unshiu TaxID=55188 RepID=A0A2H5N389_CITUN|nr:hypothetical protein CUMW_282380 [Citrus unshiu]